MDELMFFRGQTSVRRIDRIESAHIGLAKSTLGAAYRQAMIGRNQETTEIGSIRQIRRKHPS
jgi:hypothetical protein